MRAYVIVCYWLAAWLWVSIAVALVLDVLFAPVF